jgi:hypothetical protein
MSLPLCGPDVGGLKLGEMKGERDAIYSQLGPIKACSTDNA